MDCEIYKDYHKNGVLNLGLYLRNAEMKDSLFRLQNDARTAAEIVGYSSIEFCVFPDNRMDSMDLLNIIKTVSKFIEKYSPDTIFTHHSVCRRCV